MARKMEMGVLEHCLTLIPRRGQTSEMLAKIGQNLRKEAELLPPFNECPTPNRLLSMNIIVQNSKGTLKPNYQNHIYELAQNHDPTIPVVMETQLGGERARVITDRLSFDSAIHIETIGNASGLWLLWNSDKVEVVPLANTEQEIHVEVKV